MSAVSITALRKRIGDKVVLDGIDLEVARGEVLCLIGPSGSGKTSLLRCIDQLDRFDEGFIRIDGALIGCAVDRGRMRALAPAEVRRQRARVGMVFQTFNLFPHMTLLQNVTLAPSKANRADPLKIEANARRLLGLVGLGGREDAYPVQLSGGQQQRGAIARALATEPELMLFDEPTSALDPELVGEVLSVLRALAAQGTTMIIATHEIGFAHDVAHRVAFLEAGRVLETGSAREVLTSPRHERTRAFLQRFNQGGRVSPACPTETST
jgi:polar amino acid transport system ATP-binding protein